MERAHFERSVWGCRPCCAAFLILILSSTAAARAASVGDSGSVSAPPIIAAALGGSTRVIKQLIARGADVNALSDDGERVLHKSALRGDLASVKVLLDAGADIEGGVKKGTKGATPLILAATGQWESVVKELIARGADVNAKNKNGKTALHRGAWNDNNVGVLNALLDAGADVNARDIFLNTPLHDAALFEVESAVQALLRRGGDKTLVNEDGKTPKDTLCNTFPTESLCESAVTWIALLEFDQR